MIKKENIYELCKTNPELLSEVKDSKILLKLIKENPILVRYLPFPTLAVQRAVIKKDIYLFPLIRNPKEKLCVEVVSQIPNMIKFITNPAEKAQLEAINKQPSMIKHIYQPTHKAWIFAVCSDTENYKYFEETIKYQPNLMDAQTKGGVLHQMIEQNPYVIKHVKKPHWRLQELALKKGGSHLIGIMDNPGELAQMYAIKKDITNIRYIKNPSPQIIRIFRENLIEADLGRLRSITGGII